MKNIIYIEPSEDCLKQILNTPELHIAVLVVTSDSLKECYSKLEDIGEIYTVSDIMHYPSMSGIDYELIDQMKGIQCYFENAFKRLSLDYPITKNYYYTGLSFWNNIFNNRKIDAVIKEDQNFGLIHDGIPYGIALIRHIPMYHIEYGAMGYKVVVRHDGGMRYHFLKGEQALSVDLNNTKYYSVNRDEDPLASPRWQQASGFTKCVARFVYKHFGYLGVEFGDNLRRRSFKGRDKGGNGITYDYFDELSSYRQMKKNHKYLFSVEEPFDTNTKEKFIFYAMHFEPEANIIARTTLESQLIFIRMLHELLPDGWKLYVKEHPDQFKVNNWSIGYDILNIDVFKTRDFYDEIHKLKKVQIIDHRVKSSLLVEASQAVATMHGTIAIEATDNNKPVILFDNYANAIGLYESYLGVQSFQDCKAAINRIKNGYVPDYSGLGKKMGEYYIDEENVEEMIRRILIDMSAN